MAKQMPTHRERGTPADRWNGDTGYYGGPETSTEYLNKHADEWKPPLGGGLHMHLIKKICERVKYDR